MRVRRRLSAKALERRLVWLVGSPRSGSTWLLYLLAAHPSVAAIDEPLIGAHLGMTATAVVGTAVSPPAGQPVSRLLDRYRDRPDYFFADRFRAAWQPALRKLLLARLGAQVTSRDGRGSQTVVVKEPHGSEAADLLLEALPRSRMLVLVRDGRDVVDSLLQAVQPGAWAADLAVLPQHGQARTEFITDTARLWVERTRVTTAAMTRLDPDRARRLRYEDLLTDPVHHLAGLFEWLGLSSAELDVEQVVEARAFDAIPAGRRGVRSFARAATPGQWRENFDPAEQAILTDIMGDSLAELGYL